MMIWSRRRGPKRSNPKLEKRKRKFKKNLQTPVDIFVYIFICIHTTLLLSFIIYILELSCLDNTFLNIQNIYAWVLKWGHHYELSEILNSARERAEMVLYRNELEIGPLNIEIWLELSNIHCKKLHYFIEAVVAVKQLLRFNWSRYSFWKAIWNGLGLFQNCHRNLECLPKWPNKLSWKSKATLFLKYYWMLFFVWAKWWLATVKLFFTHIEQYVNYLNILLTSDLKKTRIGII